MLKLRRRPDSIIARRSHTAGAGATASPLREAFRNINWRLIVFCVALWWFIYSAPTEGILTPHFWSASTASDADDF